MAGRRPEVRVFPARWASYDGRLITPCPVRPCLPKVDYLLTDSAERAECPPGYFRNTTIDPTLHQGQLTVPTKVGGLQMITCINIHDDVSIYNEDQSQPDAPTISHRRQVEGRALAHTNALPSADHPRPSAFPFSLRGPARWCRCVSCVPGVPTSPTRGSGTATAFPARPSPPTAQPTAGAAPASAWTADRPSTPPCTSILSPARAWSDHRGSWIVMTRCMIRC